MYRFNPASAVADVAVPSVVMFTTVLYIMGCNTHCYAGGLPKLCQKCMTLCMINIKRLI